MDTVISAAASDIISRFMSFLISKYGNRPCLKTNLERLQHLLVRVHMVVEEAEGRYITNSVMLMQLKMLTEAMFEGYHVLDTYGPLELIRASGEVSDSYAVDFHYVRRFRLAGSTIVGKEVKSSIENLETVIDNIKEFVSLLNGCERMFRNPYSTYLYIDNFMFGHQVERQKIMSILMLDGHPRSPAVIPIIGGCRVGKKTLVWSVCSDERIRSKFSAILHLNGDDVKKFDQCKVMPVRTIFTVEFISDITDIEWSNFHSLLASSGNGSKVIIISRLEKLARFGTVNPIEIRKFSHEEYSYLFKMLAFGSSDPLDHPKLAVIGTEIARTLQGSLVAINIYANVLRNNMSVPFWIRVLKLYKGMMESNLSLYGQHPKSLLEKDRTIVDITAFSPALATNSYRIALLTGEKFRNDSKRELPVMGFGDIIAGSMTLPKKFQLVWESRLAPHTVISATCGAEKLLSTNSIRKKRKIVYSF
ncbi:uncharacterized protein LOC102720463 [Oryza brachyantha]|uniref:Uncharacterized protein n=1 Tax=Oryza brachyantha TaxID=4533 RepID=J3N0Q9_ORYBR|nr:uncharacterized protein LOC102720463 [Oryza brachyantha]